MGNTLRRRQQKILWNELLIASQKFSYAWDRRQKGSHRYTLLDKQTYLHRDDDEDDPDLDMDFSA